MKKLYSVLLIGFIMAATNVSGVNAQTTTAKSGKILQHIVLLKFKESSSADDVKKIENAFAGLSKSISFIKGIQWGTNNSPENLNQGLTHGFIVSFATEKDRDDYLVHPKHKEFTDLAGPHIDKVTVVDFWVK